MRNMSIINVVNFNNPPSVIHKRSRHKFGKNRRLEQHSQQLDLIDNNKILHLTTVKQTLFSGAHAMFTNINNMFAHTISHKNLDRAIP